jgi:hypothetical protein
MALIAYNPADAIATVEQLLASIPSVMSGRASVDLDVDVGQQLYTGKHANPSTKIVLPIRNGQIFRRHLSMSGGKPYFYNYLLESAKPALMENLFQQGYHQSLDKYTEDGLFKSHTSIKFCANQNQRNLTIKDGDDLEIKDLDPEDDEIIVR